MSTINFRVIATLLFAVLTVAACDRPDPRAEQIQPGMDRAQVLALLTAGDQQGAAADSMHNIWHAEQYFMGGQYLEVLWYSPSNERRTRADTVPAKRVIPVVLADGKVLGHGRTTYDSLAKAINLMPKPFRY